MEEKNIEEKNASKEISGIWVLVIFVSLLGLIVTMGLTMQ